jgi:hypothetical protein
MAAEVTIRMDDSQVWQMIRQAIQRQLGAHEPPEVSLLARNVELAGQRQAVLDYVAKLECGNCDHVHNDGGGCTVVREFTGPCRCDWGPNQITEDVRALLGEDAA